MRCSLILALLMALASPSRADIVFIAAANHTEPLSRFEQGQLVGGLIKDLGDALARRLGQPARYLTLPSRRAPMALRAGDGDLLCYTRPQWIGNGFAFTLPLIPNAEVIAAHPRAPRPKRLADLGGQELGTVLGYVYPELEAALGDTLKRQDAPTMEGNLAKLALGRTRYAVTDRLVLRHHQRQHPHAELREAWVLNSFSAPCALSPHSKLSLQDVQGALQRMVADGELRRLLAVYGI